jgi:hypothetical protein
VASNFLSGKRELARMQDKKQRKKEYRAKRREIERQLFDGARANLGIQVTRGQAKNWAERLISIELRRLQKEPAAPPPVADGAGDGMVSA